MERNNFLKDRLKAFIGATKPWTLPLLGAPVLLGTVVAMGQPEWSSWRALGCLALGGLLQMAANLGLCVYERSAAASDKDKGNTLNLKNGEIQTLLVLLLIVAVALATWLIPPERTELWVLGGLAVITALLWYRHLRGTQFGEALVGLFYGPIAVMGTSAIVGRLYGLSGLLMGLAAGALAVSVAEIMNLRDEHGDKRAGKQTLVVRYGRPLGLRIYFAAMMAAMVFTAMAAALKPWAWGGAIVLLVMGARLNAELNKANNNARKHDEVARKTLLVIVLWGVAAALGLMI